MLKKGTSQKTISSNIRELIKDNAKKGKERGAGGKKQPNWFSKDLIRLNGSLKSMGIIVEFVRSSNKREIKITNTRFDNTKQVDEFEKFFD